MGNWTASAWPILVSAALKSTVVLGAAWLIAGLLRGRSAAARHVVWTACAAALLSLPVLSISVPALRLRAANAILPSEASSLRFQSTATETGRALDRTDGASSPAAGRSPHASRAPMPFDWRSVALLVWAVGLAIAILQMLAACLALWRVRRAARPSS